MLENDNKFSFFAPAFIIKGGANETTEVVRIGGVISSEDRDTDGEILKSSGMDFSYFNGGWGKVKFEHDNPMSKEPDNIIGFPTKLIRKGTLTAFEGELIPYNGIPDAQLTPQQRTAKSAHGLMKSIEEHNRRHPDNQQKLGYSIEGEYLQRDKKTGIVEKSRITNVVLTTKPKNTRTFANIMKSMNVGYGITPETQTGFGATRKESLDGTPKSKISEGVKSMVFKSVDEAKKYFLSQGLSEEEATKKANEVTSKGEPETAEKSLSKNCFQKSIEFANAVEEIQPDIDTEKLSTSLKKSVNTMQNEGKIDLSAYFNAKQEADTSILEVVSAVAEKQDVIAKSLASLAQGLIAVVGENEGFAKSLETINAGQKINTQALLKSLKLKSDFNFAPSDVIKNLEIVDNVSGDEVDITRISKSVVSNALMALRAEGKASDNDVSAYEGARYMEPALVPLVKAKITSMKK